MKKLNKLFIIMLLIFGINGVKAVDCSSIKDQSTCTSTAGCIVYTESRTKTWYCGEEKVSGTTTTTTTTTTAPSYATVTCGSSTNIPAALPTFIYNIINLIKIAVPVVLIILGMIDFAKATVSQDEKQMKDSQAKFIKRAIAAVAIFVVVAVTQLLFSIIGTDSTNDMVSCINCFTNKVCRSTDKYKICLNDGKTECENSCYNVAGSHTSETFYKCVNSCYNTKKEQCDSLSEEPYACYECTSDTSIYLWHKGNPGTTTKCSGGYFKVDLDEKACKSNFETYACYQCNSDTSIFKWKTNSSSDDKCGSGYHIISTKTTEASCHS